MTARAQHRQQNHAAYRRLKTVIATSYPAGRFVAIFGGQIVADAGAFEEIRSRLIEQGVEPGQVLIVQAGVDYPETATIFTSR
jgi:hypothetical protein